MRLKRYALYMLVLALLFKFAPGFYPIALLRSFAVQLTILVIAITILCAIKQYWKQVFISLFTILFMFSVFHQNFIPEPCNNIITDDDISVAHFNVLKVNRDYKSTIKAAMESNADLISFQEIDQLWSWKLIRELGTKYPNYRVVPSEECCYGIAIFSKYKLENVEELYLGDVPNISGDIVLANTKVHFITSHTSSPVSPDRFSQRNMHIGQLAKYIAEKEQPLLAMGDYNCVPWDTSMISFINHAQVKDSRNGYTPTFPSFFALAQIPIDYIFYNKKLSCTSFEVIKTTSSDHYGIIGTYKLQPTPTARKNASNKQNLHKS